ncbi:MAG: FliA/WhiG family RNA polymerase sigma factor [Acidobacteriota bacterium]|nr:FliA/WhiG family RNA polymerase sigma factor [Acidobacteriota bacterium]
MKLIARRIRDRVPPSVSFEDLVSTGILGLISAIDNYDVNQAVKLKTYAEYKIRGAILDSLRGLDWAPRQNRKRARQIEAAIATLERDYCRAPTEEEVSRYLGITVIAYREWLGDARALTLGSLEAVRSDGEESNMLQFVSDAEEQWPYQLFERSELKRLLAYALEKMPHLERTILSLYFYEEMTLRDIANIVELHESRVSQLKTQAILRLRTFMHKQWPVHRGFVPQRQAEQGAELR